MPKILISFERQNVRYGSRWMFATRQRMRFEWLALLGLKHLSGPGDQAVVGISDILRLPGWAGKSRRTIAINTGRYLQSLERAGYRLVSAEARWAGPYRLEAGAFAVEFDIGLPEVRKRLRFNTNQSLPEREKLFRFTLSYARAQWLMFRGKLIPHRTAPKGEQSAYQRFLNLAGDEFYSPHLRLFARLGAVQVLFGVGQFKLARSILLEDLPLLRKVQDKALKAQFYVALAWSYQRAASGAASDRAVERAINTATGYAKTSGDRATLGLVASRTGGYLTKKGRHRESINHFVQALEAHLMTGNYSMVEASCVNIGSVIHRLGRSHYKEARTWLVLGIAISRWMGIGRDNAHGEMILGKIYIEQGKEQRASHLLKRAERIAERAGNQVNLGDIRMVWGLWHNRFGKQANVRDTLLSALRTFGRMKDFDRRQKECYIARKFPEVWPSVLARL
jgi:tetratricopeptide (TPR) repeat protein